MSQSLLFGLAQLLITKLVSDAVKEASRALGVYKDLKEITNTVSLIKAVLLDAEQKQKEHQDNKLGEWLKQTKCIFFDAEDVIDDFECEGQRKLVASGSKRKKVRLFLSSSNPLVYRVRMAHRIKHIRERFDNVAKLKCAFNLQENDSDNSVVQRPETHSRLNNSDVIGRKSDIDKVVELLLRKDKSLLSVIAIAGIGGMGKTALAKAVFNDKCVVKSFKVKMWVSVSFDFELKNLVVKIINSAPIQENHETIKNCNMEQLQNHLKKALSRKKFLLVLDDVWNEDRGKWDALRDILRQEHARGSKVLVTTRSNTVADVMDASPSCILQGLSREDSLCVFVKCAFKGQERKYPDQMELGKEMVLKCGGVPLALKTLGSSLSSKVDQIQEWKNVRDNIWKLPQGDNDILPTIKLSYDRFPSYLKRCFACFSLFEKDFHFNSCDTIVLWEALDFLPHKKDEKAKDIGNHYLNELRSKYFIQDFINHGGGAYKFKLHVLVHDLALDVSRDHEFQLLSSHMSENALHLSLDKNHLLAQTPLPLGLRTILFPTGVNDEAFLNTSVSRCKYLRVLQINNSGYKRFPHSIGKLKHLRYLDFKDNEELESLPDSVCKLQNLISLNLSGCTKLQKLPNEIGYLISLQQLHITTRQSKLPDKEIAKLTSLEILTLVSCDNLESLLFEGIELPSLKILDICSCGNLRSLHALRMLEYLKMEGCPELYKRYGPKVGKDWLKISHIKQVIML